MTRTPQAPAARHPEDDVAHQLTALYHHPDDVAAFDHHYDSTHAVLAAKMPGVRSLTACRPGPDADGNRPPYHLVVVMIWDSEESMEAAFASPEGEEAVADLDNFAQAGVDILTGPFRAFV